MGASVTSRGPLPQATYRACIPNNFTAAAGAAMFFVITGSATKTLRVQRIRVTTPTLTLVEKKSIVIEKWSTAPTVGTATVLTKVPVDSSFGASTATLCQVYTVAPTEGVLVGTVGNQAFLMQSTTAVAAGLGANYDWDFRSPGGTSPPVLHGTAEALSLAFGFAPASATFVSIEVEWTEE